MAKRLVAAMVIGMAGILLLGAVVVASSPVRELQLPLSQAAVASGAAWKQVNASGFGDQDNGIVTALEVFDGQLYAGTMNPANGGEIWCTADTVTWTQVISLGFGSTYTNTNAVVFDMIEFDGQLYAGVGNWWDDGVPGQIWCSPNGVDWTQVESGGLGNANNVGIVNFGIFSDTLYVATFNTVDGVEIWRSSTGNNGEWSSVVVNGNGDADNIITTGFAEFDGYFYAAVENGGTDGAEIWRTRDGLTWTSVITGGFGDTDNNGTGGFAILDGYLYVGTSNSTTGAQIYRSNNGTTWTQVVGDGFGDINNWKVESLMAFNGSLYAGTNNQTTGIEVWSSSDGTTWEQVNTDGFGDSNNSLTLWSVGTVAYNDNLYTGTRNDADGGEVWLLLHQVFLPLALRNH